MLYWTPSLFHIALQLVLLWYLYSMTLTYVYTSVLIQLMTQVELFYAF